MEGLKELNSPLAIISILAVLFGFIMMGLRELLWFLKGVKKTTPTDKIQEAFSELAINLKLLNQQMGNNQALQSKEHDEIIKSLDRLERKL